MKYMGSKAALLDGELGDILLSQAVRACRFVDLFAGSGAVAHFVAQRLELPVLSVDLQEYARVLAAAVIERTSSVADDASLATWVAAEAVSNRGDSDQMPLTAASVRRARLDGSAASESFITRHYGGHYFSLSQARHLDALYRSLPAAEPARTVALAALLSAASACAAAPGHTAQPFQPTDSLLPHIKQAWSRNVVSVVRAAIEQLGPTFACTKGKAIVGDAEATVATLRDGDLVFLDPPYSAVQYSRFYHVLEGIARGGWDEVSGNGRAPARESRKTSNFSMKSKAPAAMKKLLRGLHARGCRVVITFPNANASNGLSGKDIVAMAAEDWFIELHYIDSVHSTLGGANDGSRRGGRKKLKEAVIVLVPKSNILSIPIMASDPADPPAERRLAGTVSV